MRNILKITFFMAAGFTLFSLNAQIPFHGDTVNIKEVIITRKQISSVQPGFKIVSIDSAFLKNYSLSSLSDLLKENSSLFIKNYGSGGSSTPSFRGTSAGHTLIMWNGININHPMLGQSDFSLLPAGMIDNVKMSFGGASMDLGDGAIGGIINLENEPVWARQTTVDLNPGIGSFSRYTGFVKVKTGTEHLQSVTKAFLSSSQNNFPFLNTEAGYEPVRENRKYNSMLQKGFMQEIYLRKSENVLSIRFWYQSANRNLPGSILYGYAGEKQTDESLRGLINYDIIKRKSEYFLAAAWMFTNMDYSSELYSTLSKNRSNTIVLKGGMTTILGGYTKLKMIFNEEVSAIKTNNYINDISRNIASVTMSAERRKGERFAAVILIRETTDGTTFLKPDFSAGLEFRVIRGEDHFLKWNVSRNSKIPSLNDCYWNPGGNPDLKNEYSYSSEFGYSFSKKISSLLSLSSDINIFTNYIRDMIQWQPTESWIWVADNIGSINSAGLESSISMKYRVNHFLIDLKAGYSYTRASDLKSESTETTGKQLIYIPKNQANGLFQVGYKSLYSSWITDFTGLTYINAENTESLPGYTINNIIAGMKINVKNGLMDFHFKVENLFNISYQTIAYYPQPGRSYYLTFLFQIRK